MAKDEIPEISPLAKQQPPKTSSAPSGKSSGEAGKLGGGARMQDKLNDKMAKSICK